MYHKGTENTEVRGQIFSESLSFLCAFASLREIFPGLGSGLALFNERKSAIPFVLLSAQG
jgi:hypothetical protein